MSQENTSQSKSAAKVSQFFRTCKKNEEVGDLLFDDDLIKLAKERAKVPRQPRTKSPIGSRLFEGPAH